MTYLLNSWYCAGWSSELRETPIGRTLLERPVVVYRDGGGRPVALNGRCPHRFAPLARGRVVGDHIMCPYHGLVFDRSGACVHNPHDEGRIPPNARVASYPILEKNGALWIWLGDAAAADPRLLPETDWIADPGYASVAGYLRVNANYQLVTDNLLDLTHAPFLHARTVGGAPEDSIGRRMDHEVRAAPGGIVHSNYLVPNMRRPTPQLLPLWGDRPGDFRAEMTWRPATTLELDIRMSPPGADKTEGVHVPTLHYLVPENETVTHYFFAIGRNVAIEDEAQTEMMGRFARQAFEDEDEPMIRDCQALMGTTDLFSLNPAILQSDAAGIQARRILTRLIRREAQETVGHAEAGAAQAARTDGSKRGGTGHQPAE
jgi:phenylpropionate dioxygenase-like ring-hydroxylating dioxygenase large terminal subunit